MDVGLDDEPDDVLTIYADDRKAVLVTHDVEFSRRRRRNTVGRHLQLRCAGPDAGDLLRARLNDALPILEAYEDVLIVLSMSSLDMYISWD